MLKMRQLQVREETPTFKSGCEPAPHFYHDESYDLRVQADYGKEAKLLPLNRENLEKTLKGVKKIVDNVRERLRKEEAISD